jgi:hypothetical protein
MKESVERDSGHGDRKSGSQAATPKLDDLGVTARSEKVANWRLSLWERGSIGSS